MTGERERVVLDPEYATALGEALYCFALCEWNAVYCIQKCEPGYVADAFRPTQITMAGTIAYKLLSVSQKMAEGSLKAEWQQVAQQFVDLVTTERNRLIHAKPGTNITDEQRLFYCGFEWTIKQVGRVADSFADCGKALNRLYHQS